HLHPPAGSQAGGHDRVPPARHPQPIRRRAGAVRRDQRRGSDQRSEIAERDAGARRGQARRRFLEQQPRLDEPPVGGAAGGAASAAAGRGGAVASTSGAVPWYTSTADVRPGSVVSARAWTSSLERSKSVESEAAGTTTARYAAVVAAIRSAAARSKRPSCQRE